MWFWKKSPAQRIERAVTRLASGNPAGAQKDVEAALAVLAEATTVEDQLRVFQAMHILAHARLDQGDAVRARALGEGAVELGRRLLPLLDACVADARAAKDEEGVEQLLELKNSVMQEVASALTSLAEFELAMSLPRAAEKHAGEALELARATGVAESLDDARRLLDRIESERASPAR